MASDSTPELEQRSILLSVAELETLRGLVTARLEAAIVHSRDYFELEDLAFKLMNAGKPRK